MPVYSVLKLASENVESGVISWQLNTTLQYCSVVLSQPSFPSILIPKSRSFLYFLSDREQWLSSAFFVLFCLERVTFCFFHLFSVQFLYWIGMILFLCKPLNADLCLRRRTAAVKKPFLSREKIWGLPKSTATGLMRSWVQIWNYSIIIREGLQPSTKQGSIVSDDDSMQCGSEHNKRQWTSKDELWRSFKNWTVPEDSPASESSGCGRIKRWSHWVFWL